MADVSEAWEFYLLILQFLSSENSVRIALMWNHYIRVTVHHVCIPCVKLEHMYKSAPLPYRKCMSA